MFAINKITQRFDESEDRISLTFQNAEGLIVGLWLTQRLSNRLVASLTQLLESSASTPAATSPWAAQTQSMMQLSAQAHFKPSDPIPPPDPDRIQLLQEVTMNKHGEGEGFSLIFRWQKGGEASIRFAETELRQWLGILFGLYQTAEWATEPWPQWFRQDFALTSDEGQSPRLH